jgi:hypothetical protein
MTESVAIPNNTAKGLISDEKFPLSNRSLHLSVEVRENVLLAALLDKHSNCYIAIDTVSFEKNLNAADIKNNFLLSSKAADVSVVFTSNSALLIPAPFFKKELVSEYLKLQQLNKENETPCYDYIKSIDSYSAYTVNNNKLELFSNHYPSATLRHHSSIFIEYVLIENKHNDNNPVFITVFDNYMDVIVIKSGKLILYNRFSYSNEADFIYHLLWVYEQLGLDTEKTGCVFYGDMEKDSEKYNLAKKYIRNTALGEKNKQSDYSKPLTNLSPHKYRSLFTQYICV